MMEAVTTSETSVNFYETTRRNIPEDSHLNCGRHLHQYIGVVFSASDYSGLRAIVNKKRLRWKIVLFIIQIARSSEYFKEE
jgi:tRNA threonylcarbamoyladenosine modification (KEOPS) complex  Pcc1 subunit